MRQPFYIIFITVICFILSARLGGKSPSSVFKSWVNEFSGIEKGDEYLLSRFVVVPKKGWVEFELPRHYDKIKIQSKAIVSRDQARQSLGGTPLVAKYSLRLQTVDQAGQKVYEDIGHSQSKVSWSADPKTGLPISKSKLVDDRLLPTVTKTQIMDSEKLHPAATKIRFQLHGNSADVKAVSVRIKASGKYSAVELSDRKAKRTDAQNRRATANSFYPFEMLNEREQLALLQNSWSPCAPIGIAGVDFQHLKIYKLDRDLEPYIMSLPIPDGLRISPSLAATFPTEKGLIRLKLRRYSNSQLNSKHPFKFSDSKNPSRQPLQDRTSVTVVQFDNDGREKRRVIHRIDNPSESIEFECDDGHLKIHSDQNCILKVFKATSSNSWIPIEIHEKRFSSDLIDTQRFVEFTITHVSENSTPLRVLFRHLEKSFSAETNHPSSNARLAESHEFWNSPSVVLWKMKSPSGDVVQSGKVICNNEISTSCSIQEKHSTFRVSEPTEVFFNIPQEVAIVQFQTSQGQLAGNFYTAISELPLRSQISISKATEFTTADSQIVDNSIGTPGKNDKFWHRIRPDSPTTNPLKETHSHSQGNQSIGLTAQQVMLSCRPKLAAKNNDIKEGNFTYHQFYPTHSWIGKSVLSIKPSDSDESELGKRSFYRKLIPNRDYFVRFAKGEGTSDVVTQKVVLLNPTGREVSVKIFVDDQIRYEGFVFGKIKRLSIPSEIHTQLDWETDRIHQIRIQTNGSLECFVNGIDETRLETYVKRTAILLSNKLSFRVPRLSFSSQRLAIRLFRVSSRNNSNGNPDEKKSESVDDPIQLRVSVGSSSSRASGIHWSWTIQNRLFEITPSTSENSILLGSSKGIVSAGDYCPLPIFSDMGAGDLIVEMELEKNGLSKTVEPNQEILVSLFELRPGKNYQVKTSTRRREPTRAKNQSQSRTQFPMRFPALKNIVPNTLGTPEDHLGITDEFVRTPPR